MVVENTIRVRDYINPSRLPDFAYVINPYTGCTHKCKYCCAEFMRLFTGHKEEWGEFVDIKSATKKINLFKLQQTNVLLGSVTDPYNHLEEKYELTRKILNETKDTDFHLFIVTKSDMVLRDIDILKQMKDVTAVFSVCTDDEKLRKDLEPYSPTFQQRIDAAKTLHEQGIKTIIYISPILPELTDYKSIIENTKEFAQMYWIENLNLKGGNRPRILDFINNNYPQYYDLYFDIYKKHSSQYWTQKENEICEYLEKNNIEYKNYFYHEKIRKR